MAVVRAIQDLLGPRVRGAMGEPTTKIARKFAVRSAVQGMEAVMEQVCLRLDHCVCVRAREAIHASHRLWSLFQDTHAFQST